MKLITHYYVYIFIFNEGLESPVLFSELNKELIKTCYMMYLCEANYNHLIEFDKDNLNTEQRPHAS